MLKVIHKWYHQYFSSEEAVVLFFILIFCFTVVIVLGQVLAPVFTALILAYLMQGLVTQLQNWHIPERFAVWLVYAFFLGALVLVLFFLLPLTWGQLTKLLNEQLPRILVESQLQLQKLPQRFPEFLNEAQMQEWIASSKDQLTRFGQYILSLSVSKLYNLVSIVVFLVLVPVMVFFFLKDRRKLGRYLLSLLPEERQTMIQIWRELNDQIANYIRGKTIEILIVGVATYFAFMIIGVNYVALLALLVGFSVVIPYIGAAVVTLPVTLVGYIQFGFSSDLITLLIIYGVIQALDGNVLAPLLFSEAVNLHPIVIIVAVLIFGSFWGFWGVFFAIPLATLIKAVLTSWPSVEH